MKITAIDIRGRAKKEITITMYGPRNTNGSIQAHTYSEVLDNSQWTQVKNLAQNNPTTLKSIIMARLSATNPAEILILGKDIILDKNGQPIDPVLDSDLDFLTEQDCKPTDVS